MFLKSYKKCSYFFFPFPPQIFLSPSENSSDTSKKTYMIQWLSGPDTDYPIQKISSSKRPIYNSAFAFSCMPRQMWTLPSALFFFLYGTFSWIFRVLSWEESFFPLHWVAVSNVLPLWRLSSPSLLRWRSSRGWVYEAEYLQFVVSPLKSELMSVCLLVSDGEKRLLTGSWFEFDGETDNLLWMWSHHNNDNL